MKDKHQRLHIEDTAFKAAHEAYKKAVAIGIAGPDAFAIATEVYTQEKRKQAGEKA